MNEPGKEGPSGLLVDLVRRVFRAPERSRGSSDATLTLCAAAVILSVGGWTRPGLEPFVLDARAFADQPWRLLSTHFVHVNIIHLWFNLSWIWSLGRAIEQRLGAPFLIGTCLFMMLGTSAVVQAFDRGGIGLSGVVYGLWALLFVGQRRCEILRGILDARTNQLMILWFFFCIILTTSGAFPVSNWGHGAGAVLGALVGLGIAEDGRMRPLALPLGAALLALLTCGATIWWPAWNFGGAAIEFERQADAALERKDWPAAEAALRAAVELDASEGRSWWNLGVVLSRQGREPEAVESFYRAFECDTLDDGQKQGLCAALLLQMNMRILHGDQKSALEFAQRAVRVAPQDRAAWREVERLADALGDGPWGERARAALAKLDGKR